MIGRGDFKDKPIPTEELALMFEHSGLGVDMVAGLKKRFFPDDEVEISFTTRQNRLALNITKHRKVFRVFENYPTAYPDRSGMVAAILKAVRDKADTIQSYLG